MSQRKLEQKDKKECNNNNNNAEQKKQDKFSVTTMKLSQQLTCQSFANFGQLKKPSKRKK
jgi:hypothetical protein